MEKWCKEGGCSQCTSAASCWVPATTIHSRHIAAAAGEVLKLQLSHGADYADDADADDQDADADDADAGVGRRAGTMKVFSRAANISQSWSQSP